LLLASLFLGLQGTSWTESDNPANRLLLEHPLPQVVTVRGYLKPANVKGATLQRVFAALRVVPLNGAEFVLRCANPAPRTTCFAQIPEGKIAPNRIYDIGFVDFGDYAKTQVKEAQVLVRLADENGAELLTPDRVLNFVKSGADTPPALLYSASAAFFIAALGVLFSRKRGR
jgi:hypothetical protein